MRLSRDQIHGTCRVLHGHSDQINEEMGSRRFQRARDFMQPMRDGVLGAFKRKLKHGPTFAEISSSLTWLLMLVAGWV